MRRCPVAIVVAIAAVACMAPDLLPGYRPASAEERATVMRVIAEYYALRTRAAVTGDVSPLYARHPRLAEGEVLGRGVNVEGSFARRLHSRNLTDVTVDIEQREPLRALVKDDLAVAFVHGLERFSDGEAGELFVRFDLRREVDRWVIERTDEWTLSETAPPTPRP